ELLARAPGFSLLAPPMLEEVAGLFSAETYEAGSAAAPRDRLFYIVSGSADLFAAGGESDIPLGSVSSGDIIGDYSPVTSLAPITAFVPTTRLQVLSIPSVALRSFCDHHPETRELLRGAFEEVAIACFLKVVTG